MEVLRERIERAIHERVMPGCVVGFIKNRGIPVIVPFGTLGYDSRPVTEETVYDLASVTKSIPTASLALELIREGRLSLSDTVRQHIPELRNDYGGTIEDLLRYRVRGVQMSRLGAHSPEEIRAEIFTTGFSGPPGVESYTNLPAFLLGIVIENVVGESLAIQAKKRFFDPLRMDKTTYFPSPTDCAPTEIDSAGLVVRGLVHDESSRPFARAHGSVGHAGLFSTAADLLEFLAALLAGRFPAIVEGAEKGLGWAVNQSWFMGTHSSEFAIGKTGFTGTSIILDEKRGDALVFLSNRTYPHRPPDATSMVSAINLLRRDVADIVFSYAKSL